jgi:hypothetical protein
MCFQHTELRKPLSCSSSPPAVLRNNLNLTDQNDSDGSIYDLGSEGTRFESRVGHHYLEVFSGFRQHLHANIEIVHQVRPWLLRFTFC